MFTNLRTKLIGVFTEAPTMCLIEDAWQSPFVKELKEKFPADSLVVIEGPFERFPEPIATGVSLARSQATYFRAELPPERKIKDTFTDLLSVVAKIFKKKS